MRLYLDVLVAINILTDFALLTCTGIFAGVKVRRWRLVLCSVLLGFCSISVVYAKSLGLAFKLMLGIVAVLLSFVYIDFKTFIKTLCCFVAVNVLFGGICAGYQLLFMPKNFLSIGGVIYFQIGFFPFMVLLGLAYLAVNVLHFFISRFGGNHFVLWVQKNNLIGMVDTGNRLVSPYSGKGVCLCDFDCPLLSPNQKQLLQSGQLPQGFFMMPTTSAGGLRALPATTYPDAVLKTSRGKACGTPTKCTVVFIDTPLPAGVQVLLPFTIKQGGEL